MADFCSVKAKVEIPFQVVKRHFDHGKVNEFDLDNHVARPTILTALSNLRKDRRQALASSSAAMRALALQRKGADGLEVASSAQRISLHGKTGSASRQACPDADLIWGSTNSPQTFELRACRWRSA
jgi:hypothetical protein